MNHKDKRRAVARSSVGRSFGSIDWRNSTLGLYLIQPGRTKFFVSADKLFSLWDEEDEDCYTVIKERTRARGKLQGYRDGEILGKIYQIDDDVEICIYVGPPDEDFFQDSETLELLKIQEELVFRMPEVELKTYVNALDLMDRHGY